MASVYVMSGSVVLAESCFGPSLLRKSCLGSSLLRKSWIAVPYRSPLGTLGQGKSLDPHRVSWSYPGE